MNPLKLINPNSGMGEHHDLMRIRALLGINGNSPDNFAASIPFSLTMRVGERKMNYRP